MGGIFADHQFSPFEHSIIGVTYIVIGVVATLGHLTIATVFSRCPVTSSPRHLLHVNLALASIGVVGGFPLTASSSIAGKWMWGELACQFYAFGGMVCGIASILILAALSVERYLINCRPTFYNRLGTGHYGLILLYIWLKSIFWAALPLMGWARYRLEPTETSCALDWRHPTDSYRSYILAVTFLAFALPMIIMVVCNVKAKSAIRKRNKKDQGDHVTETEMCSITQWLSISSLLAWAPYSAICLMFLAVNPCDLSVTATAVPPLVAKSVTCAQPFIYILSSNKIRAAVYDILGFTRSKHLKQK